MDSSIDQGTWVNNLSFYDRFTDFQSTSGWAGSDIDFFVFKKCSELSKSSKIDMKTDLVGQIELQ